MGHVIRKNSEAVKTKWVHAHIRNPIEIAMVLLCEAFTLFTLCMLICRNDFSHIITCIVTFALILIPSVTERLISVSLNAFGCILVHLYTLFHMLGECYKLYYTTAYWDKIVHASSGVIFALIGLYLINSLCDNKVNTIVDAMFALCFSVTVSAFWEFAEFACDQMLGMDTQNDTIITEMNTYLLGNKSGEMAKIDEIYEVIVNGQVLPVEGYIDIGLIDTMLDMVIETIGALIVVVPFFIWNRKNSCVDDAFFSIWLKCRTLNENSGLV